MGHFSCTRLSLPPTYTRHYLHQKKSLVMRKGERDFHNERGQNPHLRRLARGVAPNLQITSLTPKLLSSAAQRGVGHSTRTKLTPTFNEASPRCSKTSGWTSLLAFGQKGVGRTTPSQSAVLRQLGSITVTESVCKVVLQKSIPAQICQVVLRIS